MYALTPYPRLQVFFYNNNPVVPKEAFRVKVAFFDVIGALQDVTHSSHLTVEVINGEGALILDGNDRIEAMEVGDYRLRYTYAPSGESHSADFLFCAVEDIDLVLTSAQIYNCIKREEPPTVYSQSKNPNTSLLYVDNKATSEMFARYYEFLNEQTSNIFPEDVDPSNTQYLQAWQEMVTGQYDFYSSTVPNIPELVQFIRNAGWSGNPYDLAFWVSKYIYLRTGFSIYVYIEEFIIPQGTFWTMGESELGVNTILAPGFSPAERCTANIIVFDTAHPVPQAVQNELEFLISRWGVAGVTYNFLYGQHPTQYGLIWDIGPTYNGDPRSIALYCIGYFIDAPLKAKGLSNPYRKENLTGIQILPFAGSYFVTNIIPFTVLATYKFGFSLDITTQCNFINNTPLLWSATGNDYTYTCDSDGEAELIATYFEYESPANITILADPTGEWEIGVSELGVFTILG